MPSDKQRSVGPPTRPSLLLRLRDHGDAVSWTEFVRLYAPVVFGFVAKRGLQDADAADVTQEVLRTVAGAIGRFDYSPALGGFRAWLFQITRNHLRAAVRRAARTARLTDPPPGAAAVPLESVPDDDGLEVLWEEEWRRAVFARVCEQARADVEGATWEAFHRTAVLGRPGVTVAAELGVPVAAVYLARSRVLARLRRYVAELER